MKITALGSRQSVVAVETPSGKHKLFQIIVGRDGSIMVPFPYYKHTSAQLIEQTINAGGQYPMNVNVRGPLTMHHVKYTHHLDGESHFSQDSKILTKVRRRANALGTCSGHRFTVQLQGLTDFEAVHDRDSRQKDRTVVLAQFPSEPTSLKMVAHMYSAAELSRRFVGSEAGPWIRTVRDNKQYLAVLLAVGSPGNPTARLLTLSFEEIPPAFSNQPSGFSFMGGFDAPETALDHGKVTSFLLLLSPAPPDTSQIVRQFGSVDLT
jgi:hypothetical protein